MLTFQWKTSLKKYLYIYNILGYVPKKNRCIVECGRFCDGTATRVVQRSRPVLFNVLPLCCWLRCGCGWRPQCRRCRKWRWCAQVKSKYPQRVPELRTTQRLRFWLSCGCVRNGTRSTSTCSFESRRGRPSRALISTELRTVRWTAPEPVQPLRFQLHNKKVF